MVEVSAAEIEACTARAIDAFMAAHGRHQET
jgi:hypothetical protein